MNEEDYEDIMFMTDEEIPHKFIEVDRGRVFCLNHRKECDVDDEFE